VSFVCALHSLPHHRRLDVNVALRLGWEVDVWGPDPSPCGQTGVHVSCGRASIASGRNTGPPLDQSGNTCRNGLTARGPRQTVMLRQTPIATGILHGTWGASVGLCCLWSENPTSRLACQVVYRPASQVQIGGMRMRVPLTSLHLTRPRPRPSPVMHR
jgi:hypothetical protein